MAGPATMSVKLDKKGLARLRQLEPKRAENILTAIAEEGVTHAKLLINQSPASGRAYPRGQSGRVHIASSPGEAPRSDTGTLINSIRQRSISAMVREIVDGVSYGVHLEFGTRNIAARPFMTPTMLYIEQNFARWCEDLLDVF